MKISFKDSPIGTLLFFIGLGFIFVGVAINFYNQMFVDEDTGSGSDSGEVSTDNVSIPDDVPTDMAAVSGQLNKDLGIYLAGAVTSAEDNMNILTLPAKRMALVNAVLEAQGKAQVNGDIYYVTDEVYKTAYVEVFGSDSQLQSDLDAAYKDKENVDNVIGVGNVGWNTLSKVGLVRTLSATAVTYDTASSNYVINGTYTDGQVGAETGSGTFLISYGSNDGTKYIVSITLAANQQ